MRRFRALLTPANAVALLVVAGFVAAFLWLRGRPELDLATAEGLGELADRLGAWGPVAYALVVALAVVVSQIPGVPLAVAAGAVWGPLPAGLYSVAGGFLGALVAYALGRSLGRSAMRALTGRVLVFRSERGERSLGLLILVSRALPFLPFDVISYAAGVSGISLRVYAPATLVGMIPSTFLLTFLGGALRLRPWAALGLSAAAVVALLALPWWLRRSDAFGLRDAIVLE